jgi:C-terminal processing protease CtpA/Prc
MLLSVGPILGEGRLIGFSGRRGFRDLVSYRRGVLSGGGFTDPAPLTVPDLKPSPPVAVLTGGQTTSSGEAVAVAFRGRPHTRSFGFETYGAMTSAGWYPLADGAELAMGVSYDVDRNRIVYKRPLKPDVKVSMVGSGDPPLRAAERWLLARPECKSP